MDRPGKSSHSYATRYLYWLIGACLLLAIVLVSTMRHAQPPAPMGSPPPSPASKTESNAQPESLIRFTDITATAGVQFNHFTGSTESKSYPETIGAGVGFFDYDGDAQPDLLLINGAHLSANHQTPSGASPPTMTLYRNRGNGRFVDVTQTAGLNVPIYGMGMAAADYDNDGDNDLLVTGYQRNLFFINNGDQTFAEATQRVGIKDGAWSAGAAFFDYDRDGHLDLVIAQYVTWRPELEQGLDCSYGTPNKDYCPVRYFAGEGLRLYHNQGDGSFAEVTELAQVTSPGTRAFAPYIFDYNNDMWPDMLIASDGTPSLLYRNQGNGTFAETGVRAGIVLDESGAAYAGMGIDSTYPKNDDQLCVAIGNFVGEPTTLHCNVRQAQSYHPELFAELSARAGIGRPTLPYVTFGLLFFDVDLDGYDDLFMANGHVIDEAHLRHTPRAQRPLLFHNRGTGKFSLVASTADGPLSRAIVGRGAAYADIDADGDLDLAISQNRGAAIVLRNDSVRQTHFLRVVLQGTTSNRSGIGAVVKVSVGQHLLKQMLRSGRSYLSQSEMPLTFGLGPASHAQRVEITWPSGTIDVLNNVPANSTLDVIEGSHPEQPTAQPDTVDSGQAGDASSGADTPTATSNQSFIEQIQIGIQAHKAGNNAVAIEAFEKAITLWANDPLPYRYLADLYWHQGLKTRAEQAIQGLAKVLPDAYFLDRLGADHEAAGDPGLATLLYRQAIRLDPKLPSARYNLGRAYLNRGDLSQGIAEIQQALKLYPEFADGHLTLGMAYIQQNRLDLALTHLKRVVANQPGSAIAWHHLGQIYTAQGQTEQAITSYRELTSRHPEIVEGHHNLAIALSRAGLHNGALQAFRAALRVKPQFHAARLDMGALLLDMQRPQEAVDTLQAGLAMFDRSPTAAQHGDLVETHYRLALAYLMLGMLETAEREFLKATSLDPEHAASHLYLGRLYLQQGKFAQAWHHTRQAEALGAPVRELLDALLRVSHEP